MNLNEPWRDIPTVLSGRQAADHLWWSQIWFFTQFSYLKSSTLFLRRNTLPSVYSCYRPVTSTWREGQAAQRKICPCFDIPLISFEKARTFPGRHRPLNEHKKLLPLDPLRRLYWPSLLHSRQSPMKRTTRRTKRDFIFLCLIRNHFSPFTGSPDTGIIWYCFGFWRLLLRLHSKHRNWQVRHNLLN